MNENLYEILGVSETATQDEIKKAYKKLAVKYHPDKGGSEEMFKKISGAYDQLNTPEKRQQYDLSRKNPNGHGHSFEDFMNQFMGHGQRRRQTVPDKVIDVIVGAVESYNSVDKTITYQRKHSCGGCNGTGGDKTNCNNCGGRGFTETNNSSGYFTQIFRHQCNSCQGRGYNFVKKCHVCDGTSTVSSVETMSIKIPHGVDDGNFFKLSGKGDFHNGTYGDLVLRVKMIPEKDFEKLNNDLIYNAFLNLSDLSKESYEIPHPSGNISIKLPEEFDSSKPLRIKNKGFNTNGTGDLFVKLYVRFKRNS